MKTKINTYVAATLAALMLGASPVGAMASSESKDSVETVEETNVTERAEEMNGTLFTGAIVEPGTIDQIVKIDGHNGASIVGEAIHSPGFEREGAPSLRYDFGLQTPSFDFGEESDLQFYGVASFDLTTKDWAYTVGTRVGIDENIDTRFGVINKSQGDDWLIGGFGGAKVKTDHATVDLDLWLTNQTAGLHGFIAGADLGGLSEDSGLYLAIGGTAEIDYSGEWNKAIVNAVVGYDNDGGFGMHSFTFVDLVNGVQGGKIFLADKTTIDRGTHDFKEGMYNGTHSMNGVVTPGTVAGWAPLDGNGFSESSTLGFYWFNSKDLSGEGTTSVKGSFYHMPTASTMIGGGIELAHNQYEGETSIDPVLSAEGWFLLDQGVEMYTSLSVNMETGDIMPLVAVAGSFGW